MKKRKQFTFYESFYGSLLEMPLEEALPTLWVIVTYGLYGRKPRIPLSALGRVAFKLAKPVLDSARKKSQGAVKGNKMRCKSKTKTASRILPGYCPDTDRENEVEKENEIENEVERENEIEKESYLYFNPLSGEGDGFERFWDLYPVKLGKKQAWEVWQADPPEPGQVTYAVERWKHSRQWNRENGRFIPRPAKFLEEKHYLDIPRDAVPTGASGHLGKAELEAIEELLRDGNV